MWLTTIKLAARMDLFHMHTKSNDWCLLFVHVYGIAFFLFLLLLFFFTFLFGLTSEFARPKQTVMHTRTHELKEKKIIFTVINCYKNGISIRVNQHTVSNDTADWYDFDELCCLGPRSVCQTLFGSLIKCVKWICASWQLYRV